MTIVVLGANGQLGAELLRQFAAQGVIGLTHRDIEISDLRSVEKALRCVAPPAASRPVVIVNAAAYNLVDECERNAEKSFAINATGAANVAKVAAEMGAAIVYFSTDYVFDGTKTEPYVESDVPGPVNVYGASKLAGEEGVRRENPRHYILRTSGLYGLAPPRGRGVNFVERILRQASAASLPAGGAGGAVPLVVNTRGEPRIEAVADQRLSPTYTRSLARQLARILEAAPCGLYHATNAGGCSWFEFAQEMLARVGIGVDLQPIPSAKLGRPAPRPASCVLANAALRALGLDGMEPWQEALGQYLRDRVATSARPEEI